MVGKNLAPVIIKRKKVIASGGHHGGAWKVAYADFVTAMMAFFMLMWLLNATTEKQRKGLADYFHPTIAVSRISGGGDGMLSGDSLFSEEALAHQGTPVKILQLAEKTGEKVKSGDDEKQVRENPEKEIFRTLERMLNGRGGESLVLENALKHINTKVTDRGLIIEIFDTVDNSLFDSQGQFTPLLNTLIKIMSDVFELVTNPISIEGHIRSYPIVFKDKPVWRNSVERALIVQNLFTNYDFERARIHRVAGHADRNLATESPTEIRNNRLEITLLRTGYTQ